VTPVRRCSPFPAGNWRPFRRSDSTPHPRQCPMLPLSAPSGQVSPVALSPVKSAQLTWSLGRNSGSNARTPEDPNPQTPPGRKARRPCGAGAGTRTNNDRLRLITVGMRLVGVPPQSVGDTGQCPLITAAGAVGIGQAEPARSARSSSRAEQVGPGRPGRPSHDRRETGTSCGAGRVAPCMPCGSGRAAVPLGAISLIAIQMRSPWRFRGPSFRGLGWTMGGARRLGSPREGGPEDHIVATF
jgi:hypothetical protein